MIVLPCANKGHAMNHFFVMSPTKRVKGKRSITSDISASIKNSVEKVLCFGATSLWRVVDREAYGFWARDGFVLKFASAWPSDEAFGYACPQTLFTD